MVRVFERSPGRLIAALIVLTGALACMPSASAQDAGSVSGTVDDPLGARLNGATVKLVRDGRVVSETSSDTEGQFLFEPVPSGRYRIEASASGFRTRLIEPFFVRGSRVTVDVPLPIGPLETEVTVTAAATHVLPSQVGAAVTVLDAETLEAIGKADVLDALRLVPASSVVQTGGRGGTTSLFVRGGNSNFTKLLVDGIPANDIGGALDLASYSMAGVERVEVLREANTVVAGTDALAGLVSVVTRRGRTPVPELTLSLDGGNLSTNHESASIGGIARRLDYFSELARLGTDNALPNNRDRLDTYAGRVGVAAGGNTDISATVRWIDKYYQSPNGVSLFGTPDDFYSTERADLIGVSAQTRFTDRWQAAARVGVSDQRSRSVNPTLSGENLSGVGFGDVVTITGANGYSATGRGVLDFGTFDSQTRSARQGVYGQTTYMLSDGLGLSGGADYEREQAFANPDADPTTTRHNLAAWGEARAAIADRVSVTSGLGYARIEGYARRVAPRVSLAVFLRKSTGAGVWGDARVTANAGEGIKATSVTSVSQSLYGLLQKTPAGQALAATAGIGPIGPERGRNVDIGLEQGLWQGRVRARVSYFDNDFFDLVEFVSRNLLPQFGIPADVAAAAGSGAYVNSQSYTARGAEVSADAAFGRFRLSASYTRLDAIVTRSLSSSVTPQFNPLFPGIPIGGFTALVGQRPFRRPPNTGSLLISYSRGPADAALTGYFAGKSDDSTFLVGADANFGNTLLLPNRDLNFGYAKVDVSAGYRLGSRIRCFVTVENALDRHYEPAFGFPALPIDFRSGVTVRLGGR
jgi:iron complex outermembrane receptor protein/vitamin B12 transporter